MDVIDQIQALTSLISNNCRYFEIWVKKPVSFFFLLLSFGQRAAYLAGHCLREGVPWELKEELLNILLWAFHLGLVSLKILKDFAPT